MSDAAQSGRSAAVAADGLNGAQSLLATLLACGIDTCFANPGTSELYLVAALQGEPRMRSILCLFEGVATGAADGYGRMRGKPAATLLHLGPGLANGWANLHNAKKARTPVVNLVGEHATWHQGLGASLASDLAGLSGSISDWMKVSPGVAEVGRDTAAAVQAAMSRGGQIATLILPADASWQAGGIAGQALPPAPPRPVADSAIAEAAAVLTSGRRVGILTTGPSLVGAGREALTRIAARTGAAIFCNGLNRQMERGAGRMEFRRLSGWGRVTRDLLADFDDLIIVGTGLPILSFAHPEWDSILVPDTVRVTRLAEPQDDVVGAVVALAEAVGMPAAAEVARLLSPRTEYDLATGPVTAEAVGRAMSRFLPEGAIVSDESGTAGAGYFPFAAGAAPFDSLFLTGGSIGQGLPVGLGAAIACPDRKVLCLQADGSGMYTVQALWSMARERCDVTVVVFSDRRYGILMRSLGQYKVAGLVNSVPDLFDLSNPDIGWAKIADGMGVEGHVCRTAEEFNRVFADCMGRKGPHLIEAVV